MSTWSRIERYLLPAPEIMRWNQGKLEMETLSTSQKAKYYAKNFFALAGLIFVSPMTLTMDWLSNKESSFAPKKPDITPLSPTWPPKQRGFASSLFQTSGLGTKWAAAPELPGKCDWDRWMDQQKHVIHTEGFDKDNFFTDILTDPTSYIEMLKVHHVTAHRFSLEWSVIEPKPGEIDQKAVQLYRNFIHELLKAGITPSVTLSHFVLPEWFYQSGGFQKIENIDLFVRFALQAMELFPEVKDWWSFNELGVKAFQQTREVYPTDVPEGSPLSKRVHAAGISTRNMLIAHCQLHQKVLERFPDRKLGVTHQWLKFDTAKGNWLERTIAYLFTKFGFSPVYQFFKNGRFSFEFPFMANIQFEIPKPEFEANGHFLMRLGVQAYPQAMVKMGLNHGQTYPGLPSAINNLPFFSFGSTCEPGGTIMRFGPRWKAEAMDQILDEAFDLTDQVYITEYGSDARIQKWGQKEFNLDNEAQANYLQQLTDRIRDYCSKTLREIKGIFCWSDLRRQMEWENGFDCQLGLIDPVVNKHRQIIGWNPTPAANYIKQVFDQTISIQAAS